MTQVGNRTFSLRVEVTMLQLGLFVSDAELQILEAGRIFKRGSRRLQHLDLLQHILKALTVLVIHVVHVVHKLVIAAYLLSVGVHSALMVALSALKVDVVRPRVFLAAVTASALRLILLLSVARWCSRAHICCDFIC